MHATRGLVAFPTRSHTISGVGGALRSARAAKSSSLVMTTAPFAQGLCPRALSSELRKTPFPHVLLHGLLRITIAPKPAAIARRPGFSLCE